jgi:hypothetical protein
MDHSTHDMLGCSGHIQAWQTTHAGLIIKLDTPCQLNSQKRGFYFREAAIVWAAARWRFGDLAVTVTSTSFLGVDFAVIFSPKS